MKVRILAGAVFRSVAAGTSGCRSSRPIADVVSDVSINSAVSVLVDRQKFSDAVTLLVRSRLIDADGERLALTAEGEHFWERISHLQPAGMKKWIREAVERYSRGEDLHWTAPDSQWSTARALFQERHLKLVTARLEVLDGLLRAVENWHFVSTLVGTAADRDAGVAALQGSPFFFSKVQANHIVDMRLSQRTALGRLSLAEERDAIRAELDQLTTAEGTKDAGRVTVVDIRDRPIVIRQTLEQITPLSELPDIPRFSRSG